MSDREPRSSKGLAPYESVDEMWKCETAWVGAHAAQVVREGSTHA